MYTIVYSKIALKDIDKLKSANLEKTVKALIDIIRENPYQTPPPYEKLVGDMKGLYSRRINYHHRLVYSIIDDEKIVKIVSLWTHYERYN